MDSQRAPAKMAATMPATCYIACPAYSMRGPLDKRKMLDSAAWLGAELGLEIVPSPLLDRHLGHGAWLPMSERVADLRRALHHPLIWACRGGYGSIELVPALLAAQARRAPALIGYSDITVLHAGFAKRGWGTRFYGTVPARASSGRNSTSLLAGMRGEAITLTSAIEAGARVARAGRAQGRLFPACLSVLAGLCGTPLQPDLRGTVLAIEDINVQPFQIDSNLHQLHLAGALSGVTALLGGSFTGELRADYLGPTPDELLAAWGRRLRVPVLTRLPFGHIDDSLVLPAGRTVRVRASGDGDWTLAIAPAEQRPDWG
jgi:muramoyltetrapeptide carboxypeptidase